MAFLRTSATSLAALARAGTLGGRLSEQMLFHTGRSPAHAEVISWERSLPVLAADLLEAGLGKVEMLVEHHLPLTSKRADAVLAGAHPRTGKPSYVVVELKQWSRARQWENDPELMLVDGYPRDPRLHPVAQVRGYCTYLLDFNKALSDLDSPVAGAAYLHNATDGAAVADLLAYPQDILGQLFTGGRRGDFLTFLQERLSAEVSGAPFADLLLSAAVAPSKQLLTLAADEVQRQEQFVLLGNQKLAYSLVLHEVERLRGDDGKTVVIVTGGPGSGKSVIALSLLGELARRGRTVLHATGSRSFTQTLRKVAGARNPRVQRMFRYFNQFMGADRNGLDVLILDEAHRIRETSADRYTRAAFRTGRPQVDELIAAARVPVFLLDEHQVVRPGELGTVSEIEQYARKLGHNVHRIDLDGQYRCGGSEEYVQWVRALLGLSQLAPVPWQGDSAFEVRIADTPDELEAVLRSEQSQGYGARMTAGYCWPWSDPNPDDTLVPDVKIGGWARPWNVKGDRAAGGAPPAPLWASDPGGFGQVGCIYTAQGFEYDWSGVIIGPDLVWRDGRFASVRDANKDPDFRNRAKVTDEDFDRLARNVYKVLLTRGMVGTVIYSPDQHTRDALRALMPTGDA
jgi:uncharacterized protein